MAAQEEQENLETLGALLKSRGLDAADFIDALQLLSSIKKREEKKALKEQTPVKNDEIKVHRLIRYKKISAKS